MYNKLSQRKLKEILPFYLNFVTMSISKLLQTYITHLYPFLIYGIPAWGTLTNQL